MAKSRVHQNGVPADDSREARSPSTLLLAIGEPGMTPLIMPAPKVDQNGGLVHGDIVGDNYEILGPLGAGGMGQVYRARHLRLDRDVALKVIAGRSMGSEASMRFEREMKAVGLLDHPNLVRATDAGESQGRLFLVMELVPGADVERLLKQHGRLPVPDACEVARQVALGLQAIHEKGLVHRDIKPPNLMITPDGAVKVLDLGLARLVAESADPLTEPGSLGGTADYLAPEQAADMSSATIRSDLYGLGCTLYCLLAGRPPFGDDQHRSLASKLIAHREKPVPPITTFRPELATAPDLLRLLDRLLAKRPDARPDEPREVAEALALLCLGHDLPRLVAGQGETRPWEAPARRPTTRVPIRWLRRAGWAAGALFGLGAIVLIILWGRGFLPGGPPASATNPPFPATAVAPSPPASPLRIESFEIQHYRGKAAQPLGTIGELLYFAQPDDDIKIKYRLSAPAYCYLIALNPDGSVDLCPKDQADKEPKPTSEIVYPAEADVRYGLTDGAGLQAFVLVASRRPLPAFAAWPARSDLPWKPVSAEGVWRFDGRELARLGDGRRGTERRVSSAAPAPLAAVCDYLSRCPGVDAVQATAFPVLAEGLAKAMQK